MNNVRTGVRSVWKRSWTFLGVILQRFGSERDIGRHDRTIRALCDDTLPFVNEWVLSKVRSNGTAFSLFLENKAELKKSVKLKRLKLSYSLSSCLFEALKVRHLRDQPLTDKQTEGRQTDRHTNRQIDTNKVTTVTL